MRVLRDASSIESHGDPALVSLIRVRAQELMEAWGDDIDEFATFIVVEPGDTLVDINNAVGFEILTNRTTGLRFGASGFMPSFELAEDHGTYFELVFVLGDDGSGLEVFIAKADGVPAELLALCAAFAVPAEQPQQ
jgi:hypothetical protein